jgi:hypothetical protein
LCTKSIRFVGVSFDEHLEKLLAAEQAHPPRHVELIPTCWTGWLGKVQTDEERRLNSQCRIAI